MTIVVLALAIRLLYVWMATVEYPIRGDSNQYVLYAWNLTHRGVFSAALPDAEVAVADDYRGPGYPAFLAAAMTLAGHSDLPLRPGPDGRSVLGYPTDTWMQIALGMQVILGAATVWLTIALARFWLPARWALTAGLATALWPHLVTFTGVLLSETLFAFLMLLALWLLCSARNSGSRKWMAAAGVAWGMTYLVNPIVGLFPLLAAGILALNSRKMLAVVLLAGFAISTTPWAVRNMVSVQDSGAVQRLEENFVQGSWPQFLVALNSRFDNDISRQIVEAVNAETRQFRQSAATGLAEVKDRMAQDPLFYIEWYLAKKPYLLWDWGIRVGAGDIYFVPVQHSPFDKIPLLSIVRKTFAGLNPVVFALAAIGSLALAGLNLVRRHRTAFAPLALSLLVLYLTGVHVILQAEPRYSIPYRPEEILLALTTVAWLVDCARRLRHASVKPVPSLTTDLSDIPGSRA